MSSQKSTVSKMHKSVSHQAPTRSPLLKMRDWKFGLVNTKTTKHRNEYTSWGNEEQKQMEDLNFIMKLIYEITSVKKQDMDKVGPSPRGLGPFHV